MIRFDGVMFIVSDPPAAMHWYAKLFATVPVYLAEFEFHYLELRDPFGNVFGIRGRSLGPV